LLADGTTTVIAMTTEVGSLGTEVAAGVAARLGLTIVRLADVADKVAVRLGIKADVVLRYLDGTASLLERWRIDGRRLICYMTEELLRLAQTGDVLIEGCVAGALMHNVPGIITVRACAPVESRARALMQREAGADTAAVRARIEHAAAARARTMRALLMLEDDDAGGHNVTINTDRLSVDACVRLVAELVSSCSSCDRGEMRTSLADKLVEARISSALAERISRSTAPLGVSVSVVAGRITLDGVSCSGSLHRRAAEIVRGVAAGYPIDNRIISVPSRGRPAMLSTQRASCAPPPKLQV
jgi:cytidylate kinase